MSIHRLIARDMVLSLQGRLDSGYRVNVVRISRQFAEDFPDGAAMQQFTHLCGVPIVVDPDLFGPVLLVETDIGTLEWKPRMFPIRRLPAATVEQIYGLPSGFLHKPDLPRADIEEDESLDK